MMPPKDTPHGHYVIVNILPDGEEEKFTFFTEEDAEKFIIDNNLTVDGENCMFMEIPIFY